MTNHKKLPPPPPPLPGPPLRVMKNYRETKESIKAREDYEILIQKLIQK